MMLFDVFKYISRFVIGLWIVFLVLPIVYLATHHGMEFKTLRHILERKDILESIKISLSSSVICALISTFLAFLSAYSISREDSKKKVAYLTIIYLPIFVPIFPLAIGNRAFLSLMGISPDWLIPPLFQVTLSAPFAFAVIYHHLNYIPVSMEQTASNLGAGKVTVVKDIILPLAFPSFLVAFGVSFLISWDEGIYSWILSGFDSSFPVLIQEKLWSVTDDAVISSSIGMTLGAYFFLLFVTFFLGSKISLKKAVRK